LGTVSRSSGTPWLCWIPAFAGMTSGSGATHRSTSRSGDAHGNLPPNPARPMVGILVSLIDGVLVGAVYGLAAMGLTLIWGVMNVINLTHGALIVTGMFALYFLVAATGISP